MSTLQTTVLAFEPAIKRGIQPIAIAELGELGVGPNSTGTDVKAVLKELGDLGGEIKTVVLKVGWEINVEGCFDVDEWTEKVKRMIKELGDILIGRVESDGEEEGKEGPRSWNGYEVEAVNDGKDVHIAVVTHAGFLWWMTNHEKKDTFCNMEFRTYQFRKYGGDGDADVVGGSFGVADGRIMGCDLVETEMSRGRSCVSITPKALAARHRVTEVEKAEETSILDEKSNEHRGPVLEHIDVAAGLDISKLNLTLPM